MPVNDDQGLEREADVMGREASAQRLSQSVSMRRLSRHKATRPHNLRSRTKKKILPPTSDAPATYGALHKQVESLEAIITIQTETDKKALGGFAEDSDGKNGTVYLWPYKDAKSLEEKNERIGTATHEFQHALTILIPASDRSGPW